MSDTSSRQATLTSYEYEILDAICTGNLDKCTPGAALWTTLKILHDKDYIEVVNGKVQATEKGATRGVSPDQKAMSTLIEKTKYALKIDARADVIGWAYNPDPELVNRLIVALERLSSNEAFDIPTFNVSKEQRMRMFYAEAILDGSSTVRAEQYARLRVLENHPKMEVTRIPWELPK